MREPKKRQGSVLSETGLRTRIRGRDAENLSAEQGIAMHCLNRRAKTIASPFGLCYSTLSTRDPSGIF